MSESQIKNEQERLKREYLLRSAVLTSIEKNAKEFDDLDSMELDPVFHAELDAAFSRGTKAGAHPPKKKLKRALQICAALALAFTLLVPVPYYVSASARTFFASALIENFSYFSSIRYDTQNDAIMPVGWKSKYYPQSVPESFYYKEVYITDNEGAICYSSPLRKDIQFCVWPTSIPLQFDTENMTQKNIEINSHPAALYCNEEGTERVLIIMLPDNILMVRGALSETEILEMGQSIKNI